MIAIEGVHEEDKPIVRNVIAVIEAFKKTKTFSSWSCNVAKGQYIVTAFLAEGDWEIGSREMDAIYEVNPLRVLSVSVQNQGQRASLKVRISDRNEPIMLTETQLVHVRKRSRWLSS
jgi:hypothetical protein